jgi:hypothetical protein
MRGSKSEVLSVSNIYAETQQELKKSMAATTAQAP